MQVNYVTTLEDFVAFNHHVLRKSAMLRTIFLFAWIIVPAIAVCAGAMILATGNEAQIGWTLVGTGAIFAVVYPLLRGVWLDRFVRKYAEQMGTRGVLGPITLILTEESLVEITETTRSECQWRNIHGIDVVADYTFIYITAMSAAIVPRRAFDANAEYEAVRDFALARCPRNQD